MARLPSGIARTDGRTRRLKLFLFIPRYAAAARGRRRRGETGESGALRRVPLGRTPETVSRRNTLHTTASDLHVGGLVGSFVTAMSHWRLAPSR